MLDAPPDVVDEGAALVDEFFRTWTQRVDDAKRQRLDDDEAQRSALASCMDDFHERIHKNVRIILKTILTQPWTQKVLDHF